MSVLPKFPLSDDTTRDRQQEWLEAGLFQRQFLPPPFQQTHYALDWHWSPASVTSGDWLDYWWTTDEQLFFWLADVAGHDLSSALLSMWLAGWHGRFSQPVPFLQALNARLTELNLSKHVTALAGVLDTKTHSITWVNAGHYPLPIIVQAGRAHSPSAAHGMAMGWVDPLPSLVEQKLSLAPHDELYFCSDGVLDRFEGTLGAKVEQFTAALVQGQLTIDDPHVDDLSWLRLQRIA